MKVYLAGPMSGYPKHNFPAFEAAAVDLRERGYNVISPHELDAEEERLASIRSRKGLIRRDLWAECLARDIHMIVAEKIEALVVLPGWADSSGAALETYLAYRILGLPILLYTLEDPLPEVLALKLDSVHLEMRAA